jgi:hypothetical protein
MDKQKFVDPRTPVSVTHIGKFTVTIYDQDAYEESLRMYSDDNEKSTHIATKSPAPVKKIKSQARYNWITPLREREGKTA